MLRRSAMIARLLNNFLFMLNNFLFMLNNFLFMLNNFLFIGITLHLRRLLGPLYPILAHPIPQRLRTHPQQARRPPIP